MAHVWSTACPDWEARLLAGQPLVPELPLFRDQADKALRVFKRLKLPDVVGMPRLKTACGPWFFPIVETLFGSFDAVANRRMIQEYFLLVPKKNAKSSLGGALIVTALIMNQRPEAEFLLIAPTKEIADISFRQASGMVRNDPMLKDLFHLQRHIRTLTRLDNLASAQIKAADKDVITGSKSTGILIDETHVFAEKPSAADVFVEIRGALAARPDGFLIQITTQSKTPPAGVFKQELQTARDVRDGKVELPLLPILYELPLHLSRDGGWKNRKYWHCVNPNMGRSVDEGFLARELLKAERATDSAKALALLASQHFNVEVGLALQSDAWAGAEHWEKAVDTTLTLETLLERSEVVVIGIDGGGLDDLLGLAVLGREKETKRWLLWCRAWAHKVVLDRRQEIAPRLQDFDQAGELRIVEDLGDDIAEVADIAEQVAASGKLAEKGAIGLDQVGVGQIVDALAEKHIANKEGEPLRIVGVQQGWKMSGAIKTAERKLADGTMMHAGQALMAWCVGNAKVVPAGNAVLITKQAAGKAKIDPLVATLNAVALMSMNPVAKGKFEYSRGRMFGETRDRRFA
jgi:phage terminase large subunit-like protein